MPPCQEYLTTKMSTNKAEINVIHALVSRSTDHTLDQLLIIKKHDTKLKVTE